MRPRRCLGPLAALLSATALAAGCTTSGGREPASTGRSTSSASTPTSSAGRTGSTAAPTGSATSSGPGQTSAQMVYRSGLAVPDAAATPGSALAGVTRAQVCTSTWNARHNQIGYAVQNAVSTRYGVLAGAGTSLHLDQLIPASLGGDATERNVWPQPSAQSKRKNLLESRLHQLVCSGHVSLATAQAAMAQDWTAALRKYPPT